MWYYYIIMGIMILTTVLNIWGFFKSRKIKKEYEDSIKKVKSSEYYKEVIHDKCKRSDYYDMTIDKEKNYLDRKQKSNVQDIIDAVLSEKVPVKWITEVIDEPLCYDIRQSKNDTIQFFVNNKLDKCFNDKEVACGYSRKHYDLKNYRFNKVRGVYNVRIKKLVKEKEKKGEKGIK